MRFIHLTHLLSAAAAPRRDDPWPKPPPSDCPLRRPHRDVNDVVAVKYRGMRDAATSGESSSGRSARSGGERAGAVGGWMALERWGEGVGRSRRREGGTAGRRQQERRPRDDCGFAIIHEHRARGLTG